MGAWPVREGDGIADKYVVESIIGEGGMGVVVAARHLQLEQRVAIKFLLPEIAEYEAAAERFRREARAAAKIRGEHVCRVLDVGTLQTGIPFMVMEFLEGRDLSDELSFRGLLPVQEAVEYVLQACEALAEAHAAGIIHRDLKPANLFLATRPDGTRAIKVLDFGVSKSLTGTGSGLALTKTASMVGSPLYMSPEQLDSAKDVDVRTDIWALGTILYELVTGRTPFVAETMPQLIRAVLSDTPPTFAELGILAPVGFETVVRRALEKPRSARPASTAELARALVAYGPAHAAMSASRTARVLSEQEVVVSSAIVVTDAPALETRRENFDKGKTPHEAEQTLEVLQAPAPSQPADATQASWGRTGEGESPRRKWWLLAALAAVPVVIVGILYAVASDGDSKQAAPVVLPAEVEVGEAALPAAGEPPITRSVQAAAPAQVLPAAEEAAPLASADAPRVEPETPKTTKATIAPTPKVAKAVAKPFRAAAASTERKPAPASASETPEKADKAEKAADGVSNFGGRR